MNNILNKKGFAISSLLYPTFIIIILVIVLTLITLIQSSFSINKLNSEVQGDLTDNNTMKSLQNNTESVLKEIKNDTKVYTATDGKIYYLNDKGDKVYLTLNDGENTDKWLGKIFTKSNGDQYLMISNGKYCAYKTSTMSGVAVYNLGEGDTNNCVEKLKTETDCNAVITMMDNGSTVSELQKQVNQLKSEVASLKNANTAKDNQITALNDKIKGITDVNTTQNTNISNLQTDNTTAKNFLKANPVGTIYVSLTSTNPGSTYGGTWVAYGQGRVLVGAGTNSDSNGTSWSFSAGQTGGEYTHQITLSEMPSHSHSLTGFSIDCRYHSGLLVSQGDHNLVYYLINPSDGSMVGAWSTGTWTSSYGSRTDTCNWQIGRSGDYEMGTYTGSNGYHNNVQPYVAVYMWRRTA